mmetsp:Transcript_39555/g.64383  ORF Transcript_39555/g.64383 Transcript_39555/m.64383 type:complete len:84 (-) Transcript_39555:793-1044(-)
MHSCLPTLLRMFLRLFRCISRALLVLWKNMSPKKTIKYTNPTRMTLFAVLPLGLRPNCTQLYTSAAFGIAELMMNIELVIPTP